MVDKLEENVHDKTQGLNNPETYVLTHKWHTTYLVLIFSDLNKTHAYKMRYRDSSHHKIKKPMGFNFSKLFNTIGNKSFVLKNENKEYIYVGEEVIKFQTHDKLVKYFLKDGFNDIHFGCG